MMNTKNDSFSMTGKGEEHLSSVIERITAAVQPGAVYSDPMTSGNYTVIKASEVIVGGGFGSGSSTGPQENKADEHASQSPPTKVAGAALAGEEAPMGGLLPSLSSGQTELPSSQYSISPRSSWLV